MKYILKNSSWIYCKTHENKIYKISATEKCSASGTRQLSSSKSIQHMQSWVTFSKGPSIKDVRREGRGLVKFGCLRTWGKGPCGRPQAGTYFYCFSMLCRHSLWV